MNFPGYATGVQRPLMEPEGSGSSGVLVMAEALGDNEEKDRLPLRPYAQAGSLWQRVLNRVGVDRQDLTTTNLVWYRPPNNKLAGTSYEMEAINLCRQMNEDLVARVKPKVILALGGLAYRELTGISGKKAGIQLTRGFITPGTWFKGIPVIGSYHPSFLRRSSKGRGDDGIKDESADGGTGGMALLGAMIRDLQLALEVARNGYEPFTYDDYNLGATLGDWESYLGFLRSNPGLPVSYDWETPMSVRELTEEEIAAGERERDITQGQMSHRPGQAIVSATFPEVLPVWGEILALPNPKLDWNGRKFDRPQAYAYDWTINGEKHDLMDMWHHLQPDLPRGLQYATSFFVPEVGPWKHLIYGQPEWYGALDVDLPQRDYAAMLKAGAKVRHPVSGRSLAEGYQEQIVDLAPVLDRMTIRGMPINEEKRAAMDVTLGIEQSRIIKELDRMVPEEIKNVHPKLGFKTSRSTPQACVPGATGPYEDGSVRLDEKHVQRGEEVFVLISVEDVVASKRKKGEPKPDPATLPRTFFDRWALLLPFNTGDDQVKRYVQWKIAQEAAIGTKKPKWFMPKDPKSDKDTTGKLGLNRLLKITGDPVLKLVLEHREIQTAKGTFVQGWAPGKDGRVHSTFGFKPASGQLSSESPNAQNFPKHKKLASVMNQMLEVAPGRKFVSMDWKSFHVLTTGFEAKDPLYMRMARLDMHSFFALVGLLREYEPEKLIELPNEELLSVLNFYKGSEKVYPAYATSGFPGGMTFTQIRGTQAKPTILGVGFGQSAHGMFKRNPDSFKNQKQAVYTSQMLDTVFPLPKAWRKEVRLEADFHAKLVTRFGFQRWFWDVFSRQTIADNYQPRPDQTVIHDDKGRRYLLAPGDDHEAVVAYRPANDAFGIKRSVMVWLGKNGLDERYGLINEIHDCLRFECPLPLVDECIEVVRAKMQEPSPLLVDAEVAPGGLWCEVDVEVGYNLDKKSKDNPLGMEGIK